MQSNLARNKPKLLKMFAKINVQNKLNQWISLKKEIAFIAKHDCKLGCKYIKLKY